MKRELDYFCIDGRIGGRQSWFWHPIMRRKGCASIAAADSCISLARTFGLDRLCPYDAWELSRRKYKEFAHHMRREYLTPGPRGVSRLDLYIEGMKRYLADVGEEGITMTALSGHAPVEDAAKAIRSQLNQGILVPCLTLRHQEKKKMDDYIWHWFLLTGYEDRLDGLWIRATTYGGCKWLPLKQLWDTGYEERGGLILYGLEQASKAWSMPEPALVIGPGLWDNCKNG